MNKLNNVSSNVDLDDPRFRIKPYQQIVASCTGAFITSVFVTPLDVVKIRLQTQQKAMLSNKCFLYCNGLMDHLCPCTNGNMPEWMRRNGKFNGTVDALLKISKTEGVTSLWSGLSPTLVLAVPATVVYFVSYEQLRLYLKDMYNKEFKKKGINMEQPFWIPILAGGTARIWAATLVSPLELIRTKMQSEKLSYAEITQTLKTVVRYSGIFGLWMGLSSTLLRDVPFSAIYWLNYETIKRLYSSYNSQQTFTFNLAAGAVAGSIAAFFTIPFDVVKTHRQIEMGEKEIYSGVPSANVANESSHELIITDFENQMCKIYALFMCSDTRVILIFALHPLKGYTSPEAKYLLFWRIFLQEIIRFFGTGLFPIYLYIFEVCVKIFSLENK